MFGKGKEKKYNPPEEIIMNGNKVKFHYNRAERLAQAGKTLATEDENCFFCKKNRFLHIMLIDMVIIAVLGFFFYNFYGKSRAVKIDEIEYYFTRKVHSNQETVYFKLELRNRSDETRTLARTDLAIKILNAAGETVFTRDIVISKKVYKPDEYYIENIIADTLPKGEYTALLDTKQEQVLELKFQLKEE